jgi:hypothetical protein
VFELIRAKFNGESCPNGKCWHNGRRHLVFLEEKFRTSLVRAAKAVNPALALDQT